jgi:hypothetical protein
MEITINIPDDKVQELADALGYQQLTDVQKASINPLQFIKKYVKQNLKNIYRDHKINQVIDAGGDDFNLNL